jgi:hypothetical protein
MASPGLYGRQGLAFLAALADAAQTHAQMRKYNLYACAKGFAGCLHIGVC